MEKLKKDLPLAKKLGLLDAIEEDEVEDVESRKRDLMSPIRIKKFKKTSEGRLQVLEDPSNVGSLDVQAHSDDVTVNDVPTDKNLNSPSFDESDPLDQMEKEANYESAEFSEDEEVESEDEIQILGAPKTASWTPSKKSLSFYTKVANIELTKDIIKELENEFSCEEGIDKHFHPPKFPTPLWQAVQKSPSDTYKLKAIHKVQEKLFLSIKPLLDVMDSCPKAEKEKIAKSIQLISSSNLSLNRFRRATIAPHLKPDIKKNLMALPVCHDSFFGEDFHKVADNLLKDQASTEKFLNQTVKPKNSKNFSMPSTSSGHIPSRKFRGSSRSFRSRGSYRGRRGSGFSRRSNKPNYGYDQQPGPSGSKQF